MNILADTGILLRLVDPSEPMRPIIEARMDVMEDVGHRFVTAHQNLSEFWNVCTRPKISRGGYGLTLLETEHRLIRLEATFSRLFDHPNCYPIWRKLVVTHSVQGKQVHDARLVALMMAHGITHIMTLNAADFARYPQITVIDPSSP